MKESYTTNLCQQCHNKSVEAKGDKPLTKWQWYEFVEKRRIVEGYGKLWEKNSTYKKCGNIFAKKD